jgi:hypothetical protein
MLLKRLWGLALREDTTIAPRGLATRDEPETGKTIVFPGSKSK